MAKQMAKPDTKTAARTVSIPKTKVIKQPFQQPSKPTSDKVVRTTMKAIILQKPLSNQQASQ
jgi:hypothetical protein